MYLSERRGCIYFYEEKDVNYQTCKHPDYNQEEDVCHGRYSKDDAKADTKSMKGE